MLPSVVPPSIAFRAGLAVLRGVSAGDGPAWMQFDPRLDALVAAGARYPDLRDWAIARGIPEATNASGMFEVPLLDPRTPREAQQEAVSRWMAAGQRGTVVLPTGAGKTLVALLAIHRTGRNACIIVPTRALVSQWFTQLAEAFGAEHVGAFYGDEKEVRRSQSPRITRPSHCWNVTAHSLPCWCATRCIIWATVRPANHARDWTR